MGITLDSTFWISFCGIVSTLIGVVIAAANKSKCSELSICYGCILCKRDTKAEAEIEEHRIDMRVPENQV